MDEGRRVELNEVIREFRRVGEKVIELGENRRGVFRPDGAERDPYSKQVISVTILKLKTAKLTTQDQFPLAIPDEPHQVF